VWARAELKVEVASSSGSSTVGTLRCRGSPGAAWRSSPPSHAARKKEEAVGALDLRRPPELGGARRRRERGAPVE
jgi:hypothetical protein